RHRHSAARLSQQHALVQTGCRLAHALEEHRLYHGDLPGRAARRLPRAIRRGRGGRGRGLAALLACHPAAGQPDYLFPVDHSNDRRVPTLHRSVHHDARRPGPIDPDCGLLYLSKRVPVRAHGQGIRHRLVSLCFHLPVYLLPDPYAAALGILRDRRMTAAPLSPSTTSSLPPARRIPPWGRLALHLLLILGGAAVLLPFLVMFFVSLMPKEVILSRRFSLDLITFEN